MFRNDVRRLKDQYNKPMLAVTGKRNQNVSAVVLHVVKCD